MTNNKGFEPNKREDSFYRIYRLPNSKPIQIRISNHGTHLRTWIDREYDPSASINYCFVIAKNGITDSDVKVEVNKKRSFVVNQYVYDDTKITDDDITTIYNGIIRIPFETKFIIPLSDDTLKKPQEQPLESVFINKKKISECLSHQYDLMHKLGCITEEQLRNMKNTVV